MNVTVFFCPNCDVCEKHNEMNFLSLLMAETCLCAVKQKQSQQNKESPDVNQWEGCVRRRLRKFVWIPDFF